MPRNHHDVPVTELDIAATSGSRAPGAMRIVLFIDSLRTGGAQRQFALLAEGLAGRGHAVTFATMLPGGQYWDRLADRRAVRLTSLFPHRGRTLAHRLGQLADGPRRLARLLRAVRADVAYSALHASNLLALVASRLAGGTPLAWGVRSAGQKLPWKQHVSAELCRAVSGLAPLVIANSSAGLADWRRRGFRTRSSAVVFNGIDVEALRPDRQAGRSLRTALGVPESARLVGIVGRLAPVKDHSAFFHAAALLTAEETGSGFGDAGSTFFICVGDGPADYGAVLRAEAQLLGLGDRLIWAGEHRDMQAVYNALDLLCLSSRAEGFPNVVGEAMACGVPCVTTDVGDVAGMLGGLGRLVPVGDPEALAAGLRELLALPEAARRELGEAARARVVEHYSVAAMVARTEQALAGVIERRRAIGRLPARLTPASAEEGPVG